VSPRPDRDGNRRFAARLSVPPGLHGCSAERRWLERRNGWKAKGGFPLSERGGDLLVAAAAGEVIGFPVESFLPRVVGEHLASMTLAEGAGVAPAEVDEIRRSLPRAVRARAAVDIVCCQVGALLYPPEEGASAVPASIASAPSASSARASQLASVVGLCRRLEIDGDSG
jgi:hypothetical protein